jgi:hypothetical protein
MPIEGGAGMSRAPTVDETYDSLLAVCNTAQRGLYKLGKIRGRNDLQSDEELRQLVLDVSKDLLERLPCLQFEEDAIEEMDSKYGYILTKQAMEREAGRHDKEA